MTNRIKDNPISSISGLVLVIIGMIGYYFKIDSTICTFVIVAGVGLLGSKDTIFGVTNNKPKP